MKYPSLSQFIENNFSEVDSDDLVEKSFDMVASTIDMVYNDEEMFSECSVLKNLKIGWKH